MLLRTMVATAAYLDCASGASSGPLLLNRSNLRLKAESAALLEQITAMNIRQRKFVGTVIFVTGSVFYVFFAITVAIARLPGTSMGVQLLFYLVTTLIWIFPSALLIRWMQKPDPKQTA